MGSQVDPQTMLNLLREQCTDIASKVNAMEMDKTEHTLVIQALEPLPKERKCFRMIGNVVVERTVAEVLPAVQKNRDQVRSDPRRRSDPRPRWPAHALRALCAALFCLIPTHVSDTLLACLSTLPTPSLSLQISEMITKMTETLATKQKEADDFQKKHKITSQGGGGRAAPQQEDDEGGSQGVLI